jgi:hypothetical protein
MNALVAALLLGTLAQDGAPSFSHDVAPLLVQRCASCHGGAKHKGRYSLESFDSLVKPGESGLLPLVPGEPDASHLLALVRSDDELERMPYEGDPLPAAEIEVLRAWVAAGAAFDGADRAAPLSAVAESARVAAPPPESYEHALPVTALAWSADGSRLYASGYREVLELDPADGRTLRRLQGLPARVQDLALTPDGRTLLVAAGLPGVSGELVPIDLASGRVGAPWDLAADLFLSVACESDGARAAASCVDGSVACYEIATGKRIWRSTLHSDWACSVAFTSDHRFVVSGSRDHSAKVLDASTGALWANYTRHTQTLPDREMYQHAVWAVSADPASASVITGGEGGTLHVWQPELYRAEDGTAAQMETRFEAVTHVRELGVGASDALALACSPGRVFAGTAAGDVFAFGLEDLHPLREFECANAPVFSLAIDASSGTLAAGIADGRILLWRLDDTAPARALHARP